LLQTFFHSLCTHLLQTLFHSLCTHLLQTLFHSLCTHLLQTLFHSLCAHLLQTLFHSLCTHLLQTFFHYLCTHRYKLFSILFVLICYKLFSIFFVLICYKLFSILSFQLSTVCFYCLHQLLLEATCLFQNASWCWLFCSSYYFPPCISFTPVRRLAFMCSTLSQPYNNLLHFSGHPLHQVPAANSRSTPQKVKK
jgi:hypothetical protein